METNKHIELNLDHADVLYYARVLTKDFDDIGNVSNETYQKFLKLKTGFSLFRKIRDNFTIEELKEKLETWKLINI